MVNLNLSAFQKVDVKSALKNNIEKNSVYAFVDGKVRESFLHDKTIRRTVLGCAGDQNSIEALAKKTQNSSLLLFQLLSITTKLLSTRLKGYSTCRTSLISLLYSLCEKIDEKYLFPDTSGCQDFK